MANIRSEAESKELYRRILTAATALFIQKGFERTTILDIAKLSGKGNIILRAKDTGTEAEYVVSYNRLKNRKL